jgi:hypothetical protein
MTEAEWLGDRGGRQLHILHRVATVRKLQLIAAVYVRGAQARPAYSDAKRCDDLIEAVADELRPWSDIASDLVARPGNWGFTNTLAARQEALEVAKGLRSLVAMFESTASPSVPALLELIHDVIGNPFRPVEFDAAWRSDTVLSLARGMYESRDFSAMPILADALQDADCDCEGILSHCRDESLTHVRGCWVVDLVLGKA